MERMSYETLIEARIQVGDTVTVIFHEEIMEGATVIGTPDGAGGLWQIQYSNDVVLAINPYCSKFVGLMKEV